ncbi:DUF397 domain-containing protein [Streptomyces anthocyanicus]|uniref:DUF397 domain-containing protein n=1 Tax=Streptomyces violaceoruber TaxID=1935 RepID=A0ACD4WMV6_STRVN|nr:DUF397 domain-containing protein [Streptomyces sp. RK76]MBQ0951129.1 DUF397 domain-containing protein [Streptomyces sp. RK76]WOY98831.1 DUF397 domain-containing protein [Streptomyces violaceoruber]
MTETLRWRKSSFSGGGDGNTCVEIAALPDRVAIRDSKAPSQGTLTIPVGSFDALIQSLKTPLSDRAHARVR